MWLKSIQQSITTLFQTIFRNKKKETEFDFNTNAFPLIRSVFAHTIASDLVSVQPMGSVSTFKISEPENVYVRNVIIEKTGFKTKNEQKYSYAYPSGILYYLDYKYNNPPSDFPITTYDLEAMPALDTAVLGIPKKYFENVQSRSSVGLEHHVDNVGVVGSNPTGTTKSLKND